MNERGLVAVVIVNYCRMKDTLECIDSILEDDEFQNNLLIILIDNGSNDNSYEVFLQEYKNDKRIIVEKTNQNLGFTGGYNRGIELAISSKADWVFLVNNDTIVKKNSLKKLIDPDYDILIPKILVYSQPELVWAAGAKWRSFPPGIIIRGYLKKDKQLYNKSNIIEYATGCAIMIKTEALQKVGGFDENFVNYFEDYDFFYRSKESGLKILYQPQSIILHKISITLGDNSKEKWFFLGRNSILFYRKNKRFSIFTLLSYTIWTIIREIFKGKFKQLQSFLQGIIAGIEFVNSNHEFKTNG